MKPYSKDLRLKALDAVDGGMPRKEEVARVFGISVPSIKRWLRRRRETGDVAPSPIASERDEEARGLWRWLAAHFDARRLVFMSREWVQHLHDAPEIEGSEG